MKKKPQSKRGFVATSKPGETRWTPGQMKQCDNCHKVLPWTTEYFYRRYKTDAEALAKGYKVNLQPHCKECTSRTRKESAQRNQGKKESGQRNQLKLI